MFQPDISGKKCNQQALIDVIEKERHANPYQFFRNTVVTLLPRAACDTLDDWQSLDCQPAQLMYLMHARTNALLHPSPLFSLLLILRATWKRCDNFAQFINPKQLAMRPNDTPHPAQALIQSAPDGRSRIVRTGRRFEKALLIAAEILDRGAAAADTRRTRASLRAVCRAQILMKRLFLRIYLYTGRAESENIGSVGYGSGEPSLSWK